MPKRNWRWIKDWGEEDALVDHLLREYPALQDRPISEVRAVAKRIDESRNPFLYAVVAIAFAVATIVGVRYLTAWLDIPRTYRSFISVAIIVGFGSRLRRYTARNRAARVLAETYSALFCPCGYCLLGLPDATPCPECGRPRRPPAQPTCPPPPTDAPSLPGSPR